MLSVVVCLYLLLRNMRLVLLLAYNGATRIPVTAQCKTAKGHGLQDLQANDGRAYFTDCTRRREILILQAYLTRRIHTARRVKLSLSLQSE